MWGCRYSARLLSSRGASNGAAPTRRRRSIGVAIMAVVSILSVEFGTPLLRPSRADEVENSGSREATAPAELSLEKASPPGITRADLAAAYLRLEQAYFAHLPSGDRIATINERFDQATKAGRASACFAQSGRRTSGLDFRPPCSGDLPRRVDVRVAIGRAP